jgi:hypothetical protein
MSSKKLFKNDLLDFIIVRKVAGENTGNGGSPRLVSHQPQHGKCKFHF